MIYVATSKRQKKPPQKMSIVEKGILFFYVSNKKVRQTNPFTSSCKYKEKKKKLEDFIGAELDLDSDDSDNSE